MFSSPKDLRHQCTVRCPPPTFPQTSATLSILTTPHKVIRHTDSARPCGKTLNPALHRPQRETKGTKCSGTLPDPHSHVEERPFQGRVQGTRSDRALAPVVVLARSPQRRVKRFWRNRALAPVALHPTGTLNSLTKTHTLPHLAPTVREPDSYGHTRDASRNPPRLESGDS